MITLEQAREAPLGKLVRYRSPGGEHEELGVLTGVNGVYVFVVYKIDGEPVRHAIDSGVIEMIEDLKPIATPPNCLEFVE